MNKYFCNYHLLKQSDFEKAVNSLFEEDIPLEEHQHIEREIRLPAEPIRDHYIYDKFSFKKSNQNIVNLLKYLKELSSEGRNIVIKLNYPNNTKDVINELLEDTRIEILEDDEEVDYVLNFEYYIPSIQSTLLTRTKISYTSSVIIRVNTSKIPGWIIEITNINDIIKESYKSSYILNRGESKFKEYRISEIDGSLIFKDFKNQINKVSYEGLTFSSSIETIPQKPTAIDEINGFNFANAKYRRIINRRVFNIHLENGNLVIFLSRILTTEKTTTSPMNISLEFELYGFNEYKESYMDIILKCFSIFKDTKLLPSMIYNYLNKVYSSYSQFRKSPIDIDIENSGVLKNHVTNAYITNKLDGVGKLLVVFARHIYLLWTENQILKYTLIGYDSKPSTLGSAFYVIETETYGKYYIGCYNILALDSKLELNEKFNSLNETMKSKLAYLNIYIGKVKDKLFKDYKLEIKPQILIENPLNVEDYLEAMKKVDDVVSDSFAANFKNDGYILTTNSRSRESVYKLKYYKDYTIDYNATNPTFFEDNREAILKFVFKAIGLKMSSNIMKDLELIKHLDHGLSNLVFSKNIVSDERLYYRFDKISGNSSKVISNINKIISFRKENDGFKHYLKTVLEDHRGSINNYHNNIKRNLFKETYNISKDVNVGISQLFIIDGGSGRGGDLLKLLSLKCNNYIFIEPDEERFNILISRILEQGGEETTIILDRFYEYYIKNKKKKLFVFKGFPLLKSRNEIFTKDAQTLIGQILEYASEKYEYDNPMVKFISLMSVITLIDSFPENEQLVSNPKDFGRSFNLIHKDIINITNNHCYFAVFGIDSHKLFTNGRSELNTKIVKVRKSNDIIAKVNITNVDGTKYDYSENIINMKQILRNLTFNFNIELYKHCSEIFNTEETELLRFSQAHFSMILKGYKN